MAEQKPIIQFDDFLKLDLRVAKIVEASNHPNADKLIVMKIDLGEEQRQIIAGLRDWYEAEGLVGKDVVVVANLAPRKMRGLESNGMLLAATVGGMPSPDDVIVLTTDRPAPAGSAVS